MFERLHALFASWHAIDEIEAMTERDLDDIGLSRDQLIDIVKLPADTEQRMEAMASIFGLTMDQLRSEHARYIEMIETCGHCGARRACSSVLAHADTAHPAGCSFCPNAATYSAMAAA